MKKVGAIICLIIAIIFGLCAIIMAVVGEVALIIILGIIAGIGAFGFYELWFDNDNSSEKPKNMSVNQLSPTKALAQTNNYSIQNNCLDRENIKGVVSRLEKALVNNNNFSISRQFSISQRNSKVSNFSQTDITTIYVDDAQKKFSILDITTTNKIPIKQNISMRIFNYKDLINFSVYKNGHDVINGAVSGRTGSAILGSVLFGATGAVIGASGKRKIGQQSKHYNDEIQIVINVNDLNDPVITVNIKAPNLKLKKQQDLEAIRAFVGILTYIKENAKNSEE